MLSQDDTFIDPRTVEFSSSSERHDAMYKLAARNDKKGKKGGSCNITQCQKEGASSWNRGSHAWYCEACGDELNRYNPNVMGDGAPMVDVEPDFYHAYSPDECYSENEPSQLTKRMTDSFPQTTTEKPAVRQSAKIGRNDSCPCTSGLKYKKCCGA